MADAIRKKPTESFAEWEARLRIALQCASALASYDRLKHLDTTGFSEEQRQEYVEALRQSGEQIRSVVPALSALVPLAELEALLAD